MDVKDADVILKEIINAQRTRILTGPSNETAPVRDMYPVFLLISRLCRPMLQLFKIDSETLTCTHPRN